MTEYTSAEILKIAGRRMRHDPDPEVRAMAASLVTQARNRKPILSRIKGMIMGESS